jgi:demethylmenaquinone methyltransferase/2-methoxy-6-polyprenyl-1,4-benzoquinol methylase
MSESYYEPGEGRAARVNELFGHVARRYDLLNDLQSLGLHRRWKRRVIELAAPRPGLQALDVCCGTGDLALGLARRGAETVGLDFSEAMLEVAIARGERAKIQLRFIQGDALALPFGDGSFDIVTVGYGLRNLASWEGGVREMQRVARRAGKIVSLDFGKPEWGLWRVVYFGYLRLCVPWLGRFFCGSAGAYSYILESLRHYAGQEAVAERMRELGLRNVRVIRLLGGAMAIHYAEKA